MIKIEPFDGQLDPSNVTATTPNPSGKRIVVLTHFKPTGKYYSGALAVVSEDAAMYDIFEAVAAESEAGRYFGLITTAPKAWHILVECPSHPHAHPFLVTAKMGSAEA